MSRPGVLVTGIALATGLGADRRSTWEALKGGRIAVRPLAVGDGESWYGCPLPEAMRGPSGPPQSLVDDLAVAAWADADLMGRVDSDRVGVVVGLSKGWVDGLAECAAGAFGPAWLDYWPGGGARRVAARLGACGPCLAPVAACATGVISALQGAELIRRGVCDAVVAGAVDASLHPMMLAAFDRMKVLARVDENDPASAIRPCDRGRSGFLAGEGGALLVLERADRPRAEGRRPYAELAGGMMGADAYHITNLDPDPTHLARLISLALEDARVSPGEIDHVNLHGTATRSNDPLECGGLRLALGGTVDRVSCTANKAQIGHLLGAAGAVELAIMCLAVRDGFVPPTMNLVDPDPACDLDLTPGVGREREIGAALKLSLGFGGHLAAAVVRRAER
jgi:3-oxoacyl-[acyl-carrier-protein] synthase II